MKTIKIVKLASAITIDGKDTQEIKVREPKAGELRGLKLLDLLQMEAGALIKILPRISSINETQAGQLPIGDLMRLGTAIVGFFGAVPTRPPQ